MPWSYKHNSTLNIVEAKYTGDITARDLQESVSQLIALEKEQGLNRFLIDATEMKLAPPSSLMDFYNLVTKQYVEEEADRYGRVAVIVPISPVAKEAILFFENVARNRGWMVKAFSDFQEAGDWLTSGTASDKPDAGDGPKTGQTPEEHN